MLSNRRDGDYLLLWQNHNTIVVGQNQNTEEEINRPFVEEHQIQVVRRNTGGGAVRTQGRRFAPVAQVPGKGR